jgi:hypothetical protein
MINYDEPYVVPKHDDVKVIEVKRIPLKNIKRKKNDGRGEDFDSKNVERIENLIQNGDWYPFGYEPPMVVDNGDGTYSLKTGHHRYMAHIGVGETEMWVAVVEFESEVAEIKACSHENAEEVKPYAKKFRSVNNIINDTCKILAAWVKKDSIKITEKLIKKALTQLTVDKHKEYDTILEAVKKDSGIRGSVKGYTPDGAEKTAKEIHGDSEFGMHVARLRDKKSKAEQRAWNAIMKYKMENGVDAPFKVYGYFANSEAEDVKKRRQDVSNPKWSEPFKEWIRKAYKIIEDPNFTEVDWEFIPQLYDGELSND